MKAMLGFGVLLLFLAGIAFFMLQGRQLAAQNLAAGGAEITAVSWRPALIGNEAMPEESRMFVQFEIDGSIKGHGGCNSFFGTLEQSEEGNPRVEHPRPGARIIGLHRGKRLAQSG